MLSGPVAVSEGRWRRRFKISFGEQRRSGGQRVGGEQRLREGSIGLEELKQLEKKSLRRLALDASE